MEYCPNPITISGKDEWIPWRGSAFAHQLPPQIVAAEWGAPYAGHRRSWNEVELKSERVTHKTKLQLGGSNGQLSLPPACMPVCPIH